MLIDENTNNKMSHSRSVTMFLYTKIKTENHDSSKYVYCLNKKAFVKKITKNMRENLTNVVRNRDQDMNFFFHKSDLVGRFKNITFSLCVFYKFCCTLNRELL